MAKGNNYEMEEDFNFFEIVEEVLPITNKKWNSVANQHKLWPGWREKLGVHPLQVPHSVSEACSNQGFMCLEKVHMAMHIYNTIIQ